eukprot:9481701-Pyramimonas_sp.AAC.1
MKFGSVGTIPDIRYATMMRHVCDASRLQRKSGTRAAVMRIVASSHRFVSSAHRGTSRNGAQLENLGKR